MDHQCPARSPPRGPPTSSSASQWSTHDPHKALSPVAKFVRISAGKTTTHPKPTPRQSREAKPFTRHQSLLPAFLPSLFPPLPAFRISVFSISASTKNLPAPLRDLRASAFRFITLPTFDLRPSTLRPSTLRLSLFISASQHLSFSAFQHLPPQTSPPHDSSSPSPPQTTTRSSQSKPPHQTPAPPPTPTPD